MNYGRISFTDADAQDRQPRLTQERRHAFRIKLPTEPQRPSLVCPGCDLVRTPNEFKASDGRNYRNCKCCRDRGKGREKAR